MRYFFFKYLTAEIELYYSNVHLATPLSDKRLPIIVQSYKQIQSPRELVIVTRFGEICGQPPRRSRSDFGRWQCDIDIRLNLLTRFQRIALNAIWSRGVELQPFFRSLTSQLLSRLNCIVLWYRINISLTKRNTCIGSCIAVI